MSISVDTSNEIKKAFDSSITEDWVSDSDLDESEVMVLKSDNVQHKTEQANQPRNVRQNPRNNRSNWNEMRTQKLGVGFQFTKNACFVCGSFSHLIKDYDFHEKKMLVHKEKQLPEFLVLLLIIGYILSTLTDRLYDLYTPMTSAREIWNSLEKKYTAEKEGAHKFITFKFFEFAMEDNVSILDQVHEFLILVSKFKNLNIKIPENLLVGAIITKLPSSWHNYRKKLMHTSEDFTLDQIQKHLRIEEETRIREKNLNGASSSKVNYVDSGKNNKGNNKKRKGTWNSSNENKKDKKPLSEVVCYKNHCYGHINYRTMKDMLKQDIISYNGEHKDKCEICVQAKMKRKPFPKVDRQSEMLELVHFDICELNGQLSRGGNRVLQDIINAMLVSANLPKNLWGEALLTACHRNMAESSSAPRRSERATKEKKLDPNFIDSQAIIFLFEGDKENNVVNKIPVLLNVEDAPKTYKEAITSRNSAF
nr:hypothetical protein [Tanacetum cinerariifolium]